MTHDDSGATANAQTSQKQAELQEQIRHAMDVQHKYQDFLLSLPNVVGVAVGYATQADVTTPEVAVIVMVREKLIERTLSPQAIVPKRIDGVRVDVQPMGLFTAGG